jgi:two-component system chemotaxis response regulator CheY
MTKTILTVDDSQTMLDMLAATLKKADYQVHQAKDGQLGLDVLENLTPDVIITDINMPVMDGIAFIHNVRANPKFAGTPILILTTESSAKKKDEGRKAGATGWIVKPFDPKKLVQVIEKVSP